MRLLKANARNIETRELVELTFEQLNFVSGGDTQQTKPLSHGTEQVLNIGSQASGAGAGKVTFNPF